VSDIPGVRRDRAGEANCIVAPTHSRSSNVDAPIEGDRTILWLLTDILYEVRQIRTRLEDDDDEEDDDG